MTVAERRTREKNEMKRAILLVARKIAARDGWQNLTIRKICDEIHYTAPVIYQYFESKDMILLALRIEGFKFIYTDFERVNQKYTDPARRLLEYGLAFWSFSEVYPELYQTMFNLQGVICFEENSQRSPENIRMHYRNALTSINNKARRSEKFLRELNDNYRAIIHGFIAIRMVNKLRSGPEHEKTVFKNALQRFINSINDTICPKEN